ncbi:MAG: hypothetical protein ABFR75_12140 [Acidobacteriota bacterium]
MKKLIALVSVISLMNIMVYSDVIKKTRSEVSFKKFGTYNTLRTENITPLKTRTDKNDSFKGKGFFGKTAAKLFFKKGKFSQIVDLQVMKNYLLNHKKKRCTITPIRKLDFSEDQSSGSEGQGNEGETEEAEESDIKITKNEFKVTNTGEKKVINQFPARKYIVSWIIEWESTETDAKGSSKLESIVWTTPVSGTIQKAQAVELKFFQNYMNKLGMKGNKLSEDILGTSWMNIFSSLSKTSNMQRSENADKFSKEMKKIKGYPVLTDGKYFSRSEGGEKEEEGKKKSLKSIFGKLKKKAFKKKKKEGEEDLPKFTFYTEVLELSSAKLGDDTFDYPAEYKVKERK